MWLLFLEYTRIKHEFNIKVKGDIFDLNNKKILKIYEALTGGVILTFSTKTIKKQSLIAYVNKHDKTHTIYLCEDFFKLDPLLGEDSQPGTLIHEISHFADILGLDDFSFASFS